MVKTKGKKKPYSGSSAVHGTASQASDDAPDNPGIIPEVERLSNIGDDLDIGRRSPRHLLRDTRIVRNDSYQNTNDFVMTGSAGNSTHEHNDIEQRHNYGGRSADA